MAGNSVGAKAFPDWLLGISFAATWTWAVSVLVGMALLREQGIIPFFGWFVVLPMAALAGGGALLADAVRPTAK